jgi:hypothetical protein
MTRKTEVAMRIRTIEETTGPMNAAEVWKWPEFRAFMERLGFNLNRDNIESVRVAVSFGDEGVVVKATYIGKGEYLDTSK